MDDIGQEQEGAAMPARPGDRLRFAREAQGLSLIDVANRTRVTQRHLQLLEDNDFAALPGPTYSIGFARAYARAVGLDDAPIAAAVRAELAEAGGGPGPYEMFEPADPARVPPRLLAWTAAAIAVLIAIGYGVWRAQYFTAPAEVAETSAPAQQSHGPQVRMPIAPAAQPVVLTATANVWLRIYDEEGTRLMEREMKQGESFTVPADAHNPMILTGRPDALAVTVGGRAVPPLGPADKTVSDLPISAAALLARPAPAVAPPSVPSVRSAPRATTTPAAPTPQPAQAPLAAGNAF